MGNTIDVYIVDSDGNPLEREVHIHIEGLMDGGGLDEWSDEDGHAIFETGRDYSHETRMMYIRVDGEYYGPYQVEDGAFTIEI